MSTKVSIECQSRVLTKGINRHGHRWFSTALQAATVLVTMASEKNNLATKFYEEVANLAIGAVEKADCSSIGFFPI